MFNLGTSELVLIAIVILILFGANKIPQFMRGMGQGIREFKNAANNVKTEIENSAQEPKKDPNATDKTLS